MSKSANGLGRRSTPDEQRLELIGLNAVLASKQGWCGGTEILALASKTAKFHFTHHFESLNFCTKVVFGTLTANRSVLDTRRRQALQRSCAR